MSDYPGDQRFADEQDAARRNMSDRYTPEQLEAFREDAIDIQGYCYIVGDNEVDLVTVADEQRESLQQIARALEQAAADARALEAMTAERDEARKFAEDAAEKYNALLPRLDVVTCAFCGVEYPKGTPRHGDGALADHITTCAEHPMRQVEAERDRLVEEMKGWQSGAATEAARGDRLARVVAGMRKWLRLQRDGREMRKWLRLQRDGREWLTREPVCREALAELDRLTREEPTR